MTAWTATVLTLFPEMFPGPLGHSLAGKALAEGIWRLETVDIRDFARDKHRSVDDAPVRRRARHGDAARRDRCGDRRDARRRGR